MEAGQGDMGDEADPGDIIDDAHAENMVVNEEDEGAVVADAPQANMVGDGERKYRGARKRAKGGPVAEIRCSSVPWDKNKKLHKDFRIWLGTFKTLEAVRPIHVTHPPA
jgi:hypothetical protein